MNEKNDWWGYLAHGQAGAARANHKYFARVPLGTAGGKMQYQYFYSREEYAAYLKGKSGRKTYAETGSTNAASSGRAKKQAPANTPAAKSASSWQDKKREKADRDARIRTGKKRLTGMHGTRMMDNGRRIYYAEEQYVDIDGKTKLRDKLVDRDEYDKARKTDRARTKRLGMTDKEVKERSRAARKRYKKRTRLNRAKRAVQKTTLNMTRPARKAFGKGADYVNRLLGHGKT